MSAYELYPPGNVRGVKAKPAGTTMEGMIWNANHVLDMALDPLTKKSKDILKDAIAVVILDCVSAGFILTGSKGSGVFMVKNGDNWSPPSAIALSATKIGLKPEFEHIGLIIVFVANGPSNERTLQDIEDGLISVYGIGFSRPKGGTEQKHTRDDPDASTAYVTNVTTNIVSKEHCFAYTYTDPPSFVGKPLDGVTIKHHFFANERFYGRNVSIAEVRKGTVTVPEGSGIPDLQSKLKALERGIHVTLTPEAITNKEVLRKKAVEAHELAKSEHPDEMEECTV